MRAGRYASAMEQSPTDRAVGYRHMQPGWVIRLSLIPTVLVMVVMAVLLTDWVYLPAGILVVAYWLFHSLTVEVDETHIHIAFGVGLIRRSIALDQVEACQVVRTPWYFGWGIRYVFNGWLWNVSGFYSVELAYQNGGHFRIGTDEPEALEAAINAALTQRASVE